MMYPIQAYLVKESDVRSEFRINSNLSEGDKAFIGRQDPPSTIA
jgi:hypothetical protein